MGTSGTLALEDVKVGDALPDFELPLTASVIAAGAIASRDFMPVHHDKAYAQSQGAPDVFMNILTTNGYVSRYVTDWAGPEAMVKKIAIRLGAPALPNDTMRFSGSVKRVEQDGGEGSIEVELRGATAIGDHVTGTVELTLPADGR
ncbi:MAG: acyl dehydratase [Deltaproteobacteria bacterium]|nr:acyl dehydratase [Deltaproteobacteria bacterium]